MGRTWVVNASPLIILGRVDRIELLDGLAQRLVVPEGVARELRAGPSADPARVWVERQGSELVVTVDRVEPVIAAWDLGKGEGEVLSWALCHPGARVLVDDRVARKCADCLGIPATGTLGVLLLAKKEGLVRELRSVLDDVVNAGFRIAPEILNGVLELADETRRS